MRHLILTFSLLIAVFATLTAAPTARPDHQLWEKILQQNVNYQTGKVNYKAIRTNKTQLDAYLQQLSQNTPQSDWSRTEKLAYWLNAYNAFTIKLIVDNYPISSITQLDKPWDKPFIKLGDKTYTLNQIESDILRKYTPNIHFGINCASISCPPLYNHAFTAENVNTNLSLLAKNFLTNPKTTVVAGKSVKLSKIFEWYVDDFKMEGSIIPFINQYIEPDLPADASISYLEYNWNLNEM